MTPIRPVRPLLSRAFAAFAVLLAVGAAGAEDAYPTRPVTVVNPWASGGPSDAIIRPIAQQLGTRLGQQFVVENRAGANGAIAAEHVSRATPDGTTLWLTSVGAVAINPALYDRLPYDPQRDLVPVSLVVNNVEVLVVAANAPYDSGLALVEAARKAGPGKLTMASSGTGSVPHLAMEQLNDAAGIGLVHVPYKGAAPAITDVIAGHVTGFFGDLPGLIPHIRGGKLKPIGIAAPKRHPLLPDVRTFDEMGVKGVDSDNWYALFAPKGTPAADVDRVNAAVRQALAAPAVSERLSASGAPPAPSSPAELASLLKRDLEKWTRVVRAKNVKPD